MAKPRSLDLTISGAALDAIQAMLAATEDPRAVPTLVVGWQGEELEEIVGIAYYTGAVLDEMLAHYKACRMPLLYVCCGITMAIPLDSNIPLLRGRVLLHSGEGFRLALQ